METAEASWGGGEIGCQRPTGLLNETLGGGLAGGGIIGTLGGLIGLGGAEFRLPLPISAFRFGPLEAVIMSKAMSLVVIATALSFRMTSVPFYQVIGNWQIVVNLLVGSLAGA